MFLLSVVSETSGFYGPYDIVGKKNFFMQFSADVDIYIEIR